MDQSGDARSTSTAAATENYYAYVYPTQPYQIYVCNAFWSAPTTGTDSKAGTLVHEMSHFNVVAGTDDWVYGQIRRQEPRDHRPDEGDRQRRQPRVLRREHPGAELMPGCMWKGKPASAGFFFARLPFMRVDYALAMDMHP